MKHNRSIPPVTVIPVLVYPDVRAAVDWLTAVFGFAERVRIGESHRAQLSIGADGAVIIADVGSQRQAPQANIVTHEIKVRVQDVDAAPLKTSRAIAGNSAKHCATSAPKSSDARPSHRGGPVRAPSVSDATATCARRRTRFQPGQKCGQRALIQRDLVPTSALLRRVTQLQYDVFVGHDVELVAAGRAPGHNLHASPTEPTVRPQPQTG